MDQLVWIVVLSCVVGYLAGSVNSALVVGKLTGTDIRKHGSKNAGLTNTLRVLGKKRALPVLLGDMLKAVVACGFGYLISGGMHEVVLAAGIFCIFGHIWPVFFGFKGGKGVLTTGTVLLFADLPIALILLSIFFVIVLITRYVSLGSVIAAVLFPIFSAIFSKPIIFIALSVVVAGLILVKHKPNLVRLMKGEESKLNLSK